jgi:hypothetical protein
MVHNNKPFPLMFQPSASSNINESDFCEQSVTVMSNLTRLSNNSSIAKVTMLKIYGGS